MIITSSKYFEIGKFVRGFRCYYPEFRALIHPPAILITYLFSVLKITPNSVSFMTTIFSIGALYFYSQESYFVAFLFYWVRTVLDYVDGALARYTNQCTKFGKYLDLTIDYLFYFSFWMYLAYAYYDIAKTEQQAVTWQGVNIEFFDRSFPSDDLIIKLGNFNDV